MKLCSARCVRRTMTNLLERKLGDIIALAGAEAGAHAARLLRDIKDEDQHPVFLDGLLDGLRERGAEPLPAMLERCGGFGGAPVVSDIDPSEIAF